MNERVVSPTTAIAEWLKRSGRSQESVPEELVLTIVHDTVGMVATDIQFVEKVALLYVENYRTVVPSDFKYVIQAAFSAEPPDCKLTERVSELMQSTLDGSGCNLKITLECPKCKCHTSDCKCALPFVEVDANRIWETANPQLYQRHMGHFHRFGNTHNRSGSFYYPEWQMMRKTSTTFFNVPYHINECLNFNVDSAIEYNIDLPNIIVNHKKGRVLLAYFGEKTDDQGLRMIPDTPEVFTAIFYSIEETLALQEYIQTGGQREAVKYDRMKEAAEKWRYKARNDLQMPDPDEWKQFIDNHWKKLLPYYNWEGNFNRFQKDQFQYPDQTTNIKGYRGGSRSSASSWTH